jgi:hypothetical protein
VTSRGGWIGGPRFDLFFFFAGSAALALVTGLAVLALPALAVPVWWAFLLLIEGPHLAATWLRTYLDPDERKARGRLLVASIAWLLPGLVCWAAARVTGTRAPLDLFLLVATLWSFHHGVRQHHGILAIYEHHARASASARRADRLFLHAALWSAFGLFLVAHPYNRRTLGLPATLPAWAQTLVFGLVGALLLVALGYVALRRARDPGGDVRPLFILLGPAIAVHCFSMFVVGTREPLIPHPDDPEQFFLTSGVVAGVVHGLQYLGIITAVGLRRHAGAAPPRSLAARLGRRPLVAYAVLVLVSLGYLAINAARGAAPGPSPFPRGGAMTELFIVLYWGIFFHHYYIDQKIWHVREDQRLRVELGLGAA